MHVTFYGAVREVTGSLHVLATGPDHLVLDCGLYQGHRKKAAEKNRILPIDPAMVTNVILSHAHIDHSGRLPLLTRNGFSGRIVSTRVTKDACSYLLPDAAHIQQSDADYLNYKTARAALHRMANQGSNSKKKKRKARVALKTEGHRLNLEAIDQVISSLRLEKVEPLYTASDAEHALKLFDSVPYRTTVTVGRNLTCTFYEAGHILGSAISIIQYREDGRLYTVGFTGDLGRFQKPILRDPALDFPPQHRHLDLLIMESTYGDRTHEPVGDMRSTLRRVVAETYERGGSVVIPAFAYGRTQELLYVLHELFDQGQLPRLPVYVDSPLATNITRVFGEHPEVYDQETHNTFLEKGENPFRFERLHFVQSVEESMALMRDTRPHIVLSASGMCEAGRILHHLRYKIHDQRNTILIVGYMANHTLGRRILELGSQWEADGRKGKAPVVRLLNKEYPLKAHVVQMGGFSAHADKNEMLKFLQESNLEVEQVAVVHGEEDQSLAFAALLNQNGFPAMVPRVGQTLVLPGRKT